MYHLCTLHLIFLVTNYTSCDIDGRHGWAQQRKKDVRQDIHFLLVLRSTQHVDVEGTVDHCEIKQNKIKNKTKSKC